MALSEWQTEISEKVDELSRSRKSKPRTTEFPVREQQREVGVVIDAAARFAARRAGAPRRPAA